MSEQDRPFNKQNPQHYRDHPSGIECIDVIKHFNFCTGNAIKYLWRAGLKPGEDTVDDLKKAVWYAQCELERVEKELKRAAEGG